MALGDEVDKAVILTWSAHGRLTNGLIRAQMAVPFFLYQGYATLSLATCKGSLA